MDPQQLLNQLRRLMADYEKAQKFIDATYPRLAQQRREIAQMANEYAKGYPTLAKAYEEYLALQDKQLVDLLKYKAHPAPKASDILQVIAKQRREADAERRMYRYLVEDYETLMPELAELREDFDGTGADEGYLVEADEPPEVDEAKDNAALFLSKEQYETLSPSERNQVALDNYWKKRKSKWHIGIMYERYVGSVYEQQGYDVSYEGIIKGRQDLGRDLIAKKGQETVVVQCKNWSRFKLLHEKHIFQFFGTVFKYRDEHRSENVRALFYTTTNVSDLARRFGNELGIEMKEQEKLPQPYACIKCNIAPATGEKIYHLPFDQQYDRVKIKPRLGEKYCSTVAEAEKLGFRRAMRFQGLEGKVEA